MKLWASQCFPGLLAVCVALLAFEGTERSRRRPPVFLGGGEAVVRSEGVFALAVSKVIGDPAMVGRVVV